MINHDKTLNEDWPPEHLSERGSYLHTPDHTVDYSVLKCLTDFFKQESGSVCDLGCGCYGHYTLHFIENKIECRGFDGNPNTPELTNNVCETRDVTEDFDDVYDWMLCLEVAEHIPKKYEKIFINNLHKNNKKGIIISWAVEGQTSHAPEHVNEQNNDYVKGIFANLGYTNDQDLENRLRNNAQLDWFKNTIMVFRKGSN